jgi:hypothetical protein
MYKGLLDWLDAEQRMEIARAFGVTSRRQVYNIIMGNSKNFQLLTRLTEKAEENKRLYDRARALEQSQR